jgi:carbon-monoxide dehydrogenase medium subunit
MGADGFEYRRAETIEGALDVLAATPDAELLAAGHSLLPDRLLGVTDPDTVLDVGDVDAMQGIEYGTPVSVGALTTYRTVAGSARLATVAPALVAAAGKTADAQVRNRATLGGNLATAYPVSDLNAAAAAVDATLVVEGRDGRHRVDTAALTGPTEVAIGDAELLTRIEIPRPDGTVGGAYEKRESPTSRYTLVGVATHLEVGSGTVSRARVVVNGLREHAVRLEAVEAALEGGPATLEAVEDAAARATDGLDVSTLRDDEDASAGYRADVLPVDVGRALRRSLP